MDKGKSFVEQALVILIIPDIAALYCGRVIQQYRVYTEYKFVKIPLVELFSEESWENGCFVSFVPFRCMAERLVYLTRQLLFGQGVASSDPLSCQEESNNGREGCYYNVV